MPSDQVPGGKQETLTKQEKQKDIGLSLEGIAVVAYKLIQDKETPGAVKDAARRILSGVEDARVEMMQK